MDSAIQRSNSRAQVAGCAVPIFFPIFWAYSYFSSFKTKTSYFSYFLAGEAKICNKIENGIIDVCVLE